MYIKWTSRMTQSINRRQKNAGSERLLQVFEITPTSRRQTKKTSVENAVLQKPNKMKTIHVGWMHRSETSTKFSQTKKPLGGVKTFKLNTFRQYSVEDGNRTIFEDLAIDLGFYDGRVVKEFRNSNGCRCNFWESCQEQNIAAYKAHMYLFTHLEKKCTEETKSDMSEEQSNAEFDDDNGETKSEENVTDIPLLL